MCWILGDCPFSINGRHALYRETCGTSVKNKYFPLGLSVGFYFSSLGTFGADLFIFHTSVGAHVGMRSKSCPPFNFFPTGYRLSGLVFTARRGRGDGSTSDSRPAAFISICCFLCVSLLFLSLFAWAK